MLKRREDRFRRECTTPAGNFDEELFEFLSSYPRGLRPTGRRMLEFMKRERKTPVPA